MFRTRELSLGEFHRVCLEAARVAGYEIVLTLIARRADAPEIYRELKSSWDSLHDLTWQRIIFIFAGDRVRESIKSIDILDRCTGTRRDEELLVFSRDVAIQPVADLRIQWDKPKPRFIGRHNLEDVLSNVAIEYSDAPAGYDEFVGQQTAQISRLCEMLELPESVVPCLHIRFTSTVDKIAIKLSNGISVYKIVKDLVLAYDHAKQKHDNAHDPIKQKLDKARAELSVNRRRLHAIRSSFKTSPSILLRGTMLKLKATATNSGKGRGRLIDQLIEDLQLYVSNPTEATKEQARSALQAANLAIGSTFKRINDSIVGILELAHSDLPSPERAEDSLAKEEKACLTQEQQINSEIATFEVELKKLPHWIDSLRTTVREVVEKYMGSAGSISTSNEYHGIFLSHTWDDKPFVRSLSKDLLESGVPRVWVDEAEIEIGDSLIAKIEEGIRGTRFIGVVLSSKSITKPWVKKELEIALNLEIARKEVVVLPLLYEKCELPLFLQGKLYADFTNADEYCTTFAKLLRRLRIL